MRIEGYLPHGKRDETDALHVMLSKKTIKLLKAHSRGEHRPHVVKVGATLEKIRMDGLSGIENSTLFVSEGRFPSGRPGRGDILVYAVKSWQVRVYGGIVTVNGESVLLCPEAAIKKDQKADQAQLARVAKTLGEYDE